MAEHLLMNAAGSPGGPAVITLAHALGIEVVACDTDDTCAAASLADDFFVDQPLATPGYAAGLIEEAQRRSVDWVLPNSGVQEIAHASLGAKPQLLVCTPAVADLCADKAALYTTLGPALAPKHWTVPTVDELEHLVANQPASSLTIKPRTAEGSRGFYHIVDDLSLDDITNARVRARVPAIDILRQLRAAEADLSAFVVSEHLPGPEATIVACLDGDQADVIPFERLQPGPDGLSTLNRVLDRSIVQPILRELVNTLPGLTYYIDIQIKQHADGSWRVIDINPRISGLIACCTALGPPQPPSPKHSYPHLLPAAPPPGTVIRLFHDAVNVSAQKAAE